MVDQQIKDLTSEFQTGANAYFRNLAVAEDAIQNGQFNIAKILRAAAHTQRILSMQAARLLGTDSDSVNSLESILKELHGAEADFTLGTISVDSGELTKKLEQFDAVKKTLADILNRALKSLQSNYDVQDRDVNQFLWGCYGCGNLVEGERPDACPVCGALGVEFDWFGPFYAATPEHLGQLSPQEMIKTLETIPNEVSKARL